jgi:hypothetical protein
MTTYSTGDSRLSAFLMIRGCAFTGTETRDQGNEDRVHFLFEVEETRIAELKREFFELGLVPALEYANSMKYCMHVVREARELARESR